MSATTLDEAIAGYRAKAKDCFEWENYQQAQQYAQVADWLEELGRARERIEILEEDKHIADREEGL